MIVNGINSLNPIDSFKVKGFNNGLIDAIIDNLKFGLEVCAEVVEFVQNFGGLVHVVDLYFL
jgi:hypothetical protein